MQLMTTNMAAHLDALICDPAIITYCKLLLTNVKLVTLPPLLILKIFH